MISRRAFLKRSILSGIGLVTIPTIVPSSVVFGKDLPSNRINIGAIGMGRISLSHDVAEVIKHDDVRIVAVCDVDRKRAEYGKKFVEDYYAKKYGTNSLTDPVNVAMYENYEELLADKDIDGVLISTPDHWHAKISIDAVRAGKDVYCQKPTSLTIEEGRLMSNAVNATGRIFQIGSQQRSMPQFRIACELVRNGRIGDIKTVEVRLPGDPSGGDPTPMPIPEWFNYDKWLGQTPYVPYTVDRVHPQSGYDRPGWLRCEQFGAGMITGWGAHHFDIVNWALGTEYSGPIEVYGEAKFASGGLWDVHGDYHTEMVYANGAVVTGTTESAEKPNGVLFNGTEGWIFVSRGAYTATANDPVSTTSPALQASDPKILQSEIGPNEIHLMRSDEQHSNWLESMRTRKPNIAPAEVAHRACSACLLQHIAMKLGRRLKWDPIHERFLNDDQANSMLSRPQRFPYIID